MIAINFMPQEHNERVTLGHGCGVCSKPLWFSKLYVIVFKIKAKHKKLELDE